MQQTTTQKKNQDSDSATLQTTKKQLKTQKNTKNTTSKHKI